MAGRITEFFGFSPLDPAAAPYVAKRRCPFVNAPCIKPTLGACSLQQTNSEPVIICPNRLYANGHAILADIAVMAFGAGVTLSSSAEIKAAKVGKTLTGNEVAVFGKYWGSELSIPQPRNGDDEASDGFYIDYVLARLTNTGDVLEFTAVEIQTIDTTGTYRPQSEAFFAGRPFTAGSGADSGWSTVGLNWANVSKRILPQLITKATFCVANANAARGFSLCAPQPCLSASGAGSAQNCSNILSRQAPLPSSPTTSAAIRCLAIAVR